MIKSRICSWEIDRFIQAAIDEVTLRFGADILANAKKTFAVFIVIRPDAIGNNKIREQQTRLHKVQKFDRKK